MAYQVPEGPLWGSMAQGVNRPRENICNIIWYCKIKCLPLYRVDSVMETHPRRGSRPFGTAGTYLKGLDKERAHARSGTRQNHRENKIRPFPGLWVSIRGLFDRPTLCGFDSGNHLTKYGINPRTISGDPLPGSWVPVLKFFSIMTFYKLIAEHPLTPAGTLTVYEYYEKFQRVPLYCVYYTTAHTPAGCANVWRTGLTRKPSARQIRAYVESLSY